MSLLVRSEIPGLLVKPLTADVSYSRHNTGNLPQPIQMHLFKNEKLLVDIL